MIYQRPSITLSHDLKGSRDKKWDEKPCFYISFRWWSFCDRSESFESKTLFSEEKNLHTLIYIRRKEWISPLKYLVFWQVDGFHDYSLLYWWLEYRWHTRVGSVLLRLISSNSHQPTAYLNSIKVQLNISYCAKLLACTTGKYLLIAFIWMVTL